MIKILARLQNGMLNHITKYIKYHDVCYNMGKNKDDYDKSKIKSLDEIP